MANTVGITISDTSNLEGGQRIVIAAAKRAFEPAAPGPSLFSNERIGQGEKQWDIYTYERLADASALTEGVDLAQVQQLVTAQTQITPAEHGIISTLSKRLMRRQADSNVVTTTGALLGASLMRRFDKDVIALFDSITLSTPGASLALDITHFRNSMATLQTDSGVAFGPAPMPYVADLHSEQISDIILDITDTAPRGTTTGITDDLLGRWWKGSDRLYGVQVHHGGNIARDSLNDSKGFLGSSETLHTVIANTAEATREEDNSLRATEYGIFQEWSEAIRANAYGVEVYSDTTAGVS